MLKKTIQREIFIPGDLLMKLICQTVRRFPVIVSQLSISTPCYSRA